MRAIVSSATGPVLQDYVKPSIAPGCVVVRVAAAALNRADLAMLKGASHGAAGGAGQPLGLEWAGEIVEIGAGVDDWKPGDRVMGAGPCAFAEYLVAPAEWIYPVPESVSYEQAAALPVSIQTMHDALLSNGHITSGQTVLFQGASSAVGLMGMQIAKYLGAGRVIGTSTSAERRARLGEFGADLVVDSRDPGWVDEVLEATGQTGVDLLIDFLAGPLIVPNLKVTRIGGCIVNVGRMAGERGEFDFDLHSLRRITYVGVTFRTRTLAQISEVIDNARHQLIPALADGALTMPIDRTYRFDEFSEAFERMSCNEHFGKIVLTVNPV